MADELNGRKIAFLVAQEGVEEFAGGAHDVAPAGATAGSA